MEGSAQLPNVPILEHPRVCAIEGFEGRDEVELSFSAGEELIFYGSDESGWAEGQLIYEDEAYGKRGWFPVKCVDLLEVIQKTAEIKRSASTETESTLNSFLVNRPSIADLQSKNILTSNEEEILVQKQKKVNKLVRFMTMRPEKKQLEERNIIHEEQTNKKELSSKKTTLNKFFQSKLIKNKVIKEPVLGVSLEELFERQYYDEHPPEDGKGPSLRRSRSRSGSSLRRAAITEEDWISKVSMIPIIEICVHYINITALDEEGIFRVSGSASEIANLHKLFESQSQQTIVEYLFDKNNKINVHSVASLLKRFFRELPNPLIPQTLYTKLEECMEMQDEELQKTTYDLLVDSLPKPNFRAFDYLIHFLYTVSQHADKNKMDPKNLSITWGPTIMRSDLEDEGVGFPTITNTYCAILRGILEKYPVLYAGKEDPTNISSNNNSVVYSNGS